SMTWDRLVAGRHYTSKELIIREINSNGRITSCVWDCGNPYSRTWTSPDGITQAVTYRDDRGSIDKHVMTPKSGSSESPITREWTYLPYSETSSYVDWLRFTKPTQYEDWRGKTYDYVYSNSHGGLLNRTRPTPGVGAYASIRPQTRMAYQSLGGGIIKPNEQSSCALSASCNNQSTERLTTWTYNAQNKRVETLTTKGGDGSAASTTTTTYTPQGDVASIDGPLPGAGDTTWFYYDEIRRLRAEVSPDPDGSGPRRHKVTRYTYNADGNVTMEEVGHVNTPTNWASMTVTSRQEYEYDPYGRKIQEEMVYIGGAQSGQIGSLTQYSYDALGNIKCTAQRMNPAAFSSLPDACVLGSEGSDGPDRITRTYHNVHGQVEKVVKAYGTPLQQDYKTYDYYADGALKSVKDANGNLTTYEYDGFNRLIKTKFPSKTTAGQSSNTEFEA
ncbi:MAG: RHS repeat domain-containing protein, partial [Pseudomonadota bacterium]